MATTQVSEVHRLLKVWYPITMEVGLELLDYHYADEKVRTLAVRRIAKISNSELKNFLLQLVQVFDTHYTIIMRIGKFLTVKMFCHMVFAFISTKLICFDV